MPGESLFCGWSIPPLGSPSVLRRDWALRYRSGITIARKKEVGMSNSTSLNPVHVSDVTTRSVAATHPAMAFWHTMIGKKVVMAVTGVVLVAFVIAHMLGNLKIYSGPD